MPTVVLGYVPKPEGEAALAASIAEAQLREAELVVVNSHRARHGDPAANATIEQELEEVRGPGRRRPASPSTSASPRPASRPPRTCSASPTRSPPS